MALFRLLAVCLTFVSVVCQLAGIDLGHDSIKVHSFPILTTSFPLNLLYQELTHDEPSPHISVRLL